MNATQVRRHASSYGFKLTLDDDGKLHARGNGKAMTPELKSLIESHKTGIIESLKSQEKADRDSNAEVIRWFWGFASANVGGFREHEGEIIDVPQMSKSLQEAALKIAEMPRDLATEEAAFRAAESAWVNQVREFREVFEDGAVWTEKTPEELFEGGQPYF